MYENHFGLKEKPFSITPNPRFLFLSEQHREALAHLVYGTDDMGSFALLTGEIGTGKTTLSRFLLEQVPEDMHIALILNPMQTPLELLKTICDEFRIDYPSPCDSRKELIDQLNQYLLSVHGRNERSVIVIDEAQNLDFETLEQIRLLTNLETGNHKLLKIILIGQPELRNMIDQPELRQLSQRITARYHLPPLNKKETTAYIKHRLKVAGGHPGIFTRQAIDKLYSLAGGVPRLINVFAERALLGAYAHDKRSVDKRMVSKAAQELLNSRSTSFTSLNLLSGLALLLATAGILLSAWGMMTDYYQDDSLQPDTSINKQQSSIIIDTSTDSNHSATTSTIEPANTQVDKPTETGIKAQLPTESYNEAGQLDQTDPVIISTTTDSIGKTTETDTLTDASIGLKKRLMTAGSALRAYTTLFDLWGESYTPSDESTTCDVAKTAGLGCLYSSEGLEKLASYNVAAILELRDATQARKLAVLRSLNDEDIELIIDGNRVFTTPSELNAIWEGKFLLFWRMPPGKEDTLKKGMTGKSIPWLATMLSKTLSITLKSNNPERFNKELTAALITFQTLNHIDADGIAGVETFIRLQTGSGLNQVPRLRE